MLFASIVTLAVSVFYACVGVLCLSYIPSAFRGEFREPEDLLLLFVWLAVSIPLCTAAAAAGILPLRGIRPSRRTVWFVNLGLVIPASLLLAWLVGETTLDISADQTIAAFALGISLIPIASFNYYCR